MKFDYSNAFRQYFYNEARTICPALLHMLLQAYGRLTDLYYNQEIVLSQRGVQQGDPLGPPAFCIDTMNLTYSLLSRLNVWYLDDGKIGNMDDIIDIMDDIRKVINFCINLVWF